MEESRAKGQEAYEASADHRDDDLMVKPEHLGLTEGLHVKREHGDK